MIAILVAAGNSRRMGFDKLTADLAGKPVLVHSLLTFDQCTSVEKIILVARADRVAEFEALGPAFQITKLTSVIAGGGERHLSVWNGIQACHATPSDYIAVHDAARPLVTPEAIEACLTLAKRHGACACASPVSDTLKRATAEGLVTGSVERDHLWAMQTPQIFLASLLEQAYKQVLRGGEAVTDEISAVQKLGISPSLLQNDQPNFKITLPRDLDLARLVLASRADT